MVILGRERFALYGCIFMPTDFAAIYSGIRCDLPRLIKIVKQVMIRASEVPAELVVRHWLRTLFPSRISCNKGELVDVCDDGHLVGEQSTTGQNW